MSPGVPLMTPMKQEARQSFSIPDGEIFLVLPHGGHDDLFGQVQVLGVEGPQDHIGRLDQVVHVVQEVRVWDHVGLLFGGGLLDFVPDHLAALIRVRYHPSLPQNFQVVPRFHHVQGPQFQGPESLCFPAAVKPRHLKGNNRPGKDRQNPADRPGELEIPIAPALHLGETDLLDDGGEHVRKYFGGKPSPAFLHGHYHLALGRHLALQGRGRDSLCLGETLPGAGRQAVCVESH